MPLIVKKKTNFILGFLLLLLAFMALFLIRYSQTDFGPFYEDSETLVDTNDLMVTQQLNEKDLLPGDVPLVTIIDPVRGLPDAKVTIVEFSDFECPFCGDMQNIIEDVLVKYSDSVRHVWKDAPSVSIHKNALSAHMAARCAQDQNAFWDYHDKLFENQGNLTPATLAAIAGETNLNKRTWQSCFDAETGKARVERTITEAEVLGVDSTPYFFINDKRISGKVTFEKIDQIVQQELQ